MLEIMQDFDLYDCVGISCVWPKIKKKNFPSLSVPYSLTRSQLCSFHLVRQVVRLCAPFFGATNVMRCIHQSMADKCVAIRISRITSVKQVDRYAVPTLPLCRPNTQNIQFDNKTIINLCVASNNVFAVCHRFVGIVNDASHRHQHTDAR